MEGDSPEGNVVVVVVVVVEVTAAAATLEPHDKNGFSFGKYWNKKLENFFSLV